MANLKEKYVNEIAPKLREELELKNIMEVPRITKITLNNILKGRWLDTKALS